jgi:hypothetical protein
VLPVIVLVGTEGVIVDEITVEETTEDCDVGEEEGEIVEVDATVEAVTVEDTTDEILLCVNGGVVTVDGIDDVGASVVTFVHPYTVAEAASQPLGCGCEKSVQFKKFEE